MSKENEGNKLNVSEFKFQFEGERFIREVLVDGRELLKDTHLLTIEFIDESRLMHVIISHRRNKIVEVYCDVSKTLLYYDEISNNVRVLRSDARENEPKDISFSLLQRY